MKSVVQNLLLGLMVADLQRGVIVDERCLQFVDSDSVDSTLFTVEFDPVQVDHRGEDGQLHIPLAQEKQKKGWR